MPDTTNTNDLYAALRDDPCDWPRWMVYADALEEECGNYRVSTHAATDFRDAGRLMREMMSGDVTSIDLLIEYRFAEYLLFQAFDERRLSALPENVWIAVQQLAAERDEEHFAYHHICGGVRYQYEGWPLTPEHIRLAATVGRDPGAYAAEYLQMPDAMPTQWPDVRMLLAVRRTDRKIRVGLFSEGHRDTDRASIQQNALAWADA